MNFIIVDILIICGCIALSVVALRYQKNKNKQKRALYQAIADKYGMQMKEQKAGIEMMFGLGMQKGERIIKVYEIMRGTRKSKSIVTNIVIENTPFGFDFKIGHEHIFSKAGKKLGKTDIEFGEEDFDKEFLLKSNHPESFKQLLNEDIRKELMSISDDLEMAIEHTDKVMSYSQIGPLKNQKQFDAFERVLAFMINLSESLY